MTPSGQAPIRGSARGVAVPDRATVGVRRILAARPEVECNEWLDAEALAEFICPYPTTAGAIEVDPRRGGRFLVTMVDPYRVVEIRGEYRELDSPHRLRSTWNSGYGGGFDSIVTVILNSYGDGQTHKTSNTRTCPCPPRLGGHSRRERRPNADVAAAP